MLGSWKSCQRNSQKLNLQIFDDYFLSKSLHADLCLYPQLQKIVWWVRILCSWKYCNSRLDLCRYFHDSIFSERPHLSTVSPELEDHVSSCSRVQLLWLTCVNKPVDGTRGRPWLSERYPFLCHALSERLLSMTVRQKSMLSMIHTTVNTLRLDVREFRAVSWDVGTCGLWRPRGRSTRVRWHVVSGPWPGILFAVG